MGANFGRQHCDTSNLQYLVPAAPQLGLGWMNGVHGVVLKSSSLLVSQSKVEEKPSSQNLFDEQLPNAAAP